MWFNCYYQQVTEFKLNIFFILYNYYNDEKLKNAILSKRICRYFP